MAGEWGVLSWRRNKTPAAEKASDAAPGVREDESDFFVIQRRGRMEGGDAGGAEGGANAVQDEGMEVNI